MLQQKSLPVAMLESWERHRTKPALLYRVRGEFQSISYEEFRKKVFEIASGLRANGISAGDRVAIQAENSKEWGLIDWAVLSLGAVTVPIYPTLLADQVGYLLKDSGSKLIFAGDSKLQSKAHSAISAEELTTRMVVIDGPRPNLESIIEDGRASGWSESEWEQGARTVDPESLATLIYTSGTTGEPKGVMLTHANFTFLCEAIRESLPADHRDRFLSFLPLSHVYERMAGHFLPIYLGADIAYAESLRTLAQDITIAKPTILLTVPRFTEGVKSKITQTVQEGSGLKKKLFSIVVSRGAERIKNKMRPVGFMGGLLDKLVGAKIRERLGGRIRFMVSGGAALPTDVAEFYGAFGILLLQGYGLTETSPVISLNHPDRNDPSSVGEVLPGIECKIADDGEILMRGASLMKGYYNKPEETAQAIDRDGWFHTGDLGRMAGNRLWITGRKKDIIVMANGKNVGPERIENMIKSSDYVEEAMVFGDDMEYLAALVVPDFENLKHFAEAKGLDIGHNEDLVEHPAVREMFKSQIDRVNKSLPDFEKVKRFKVMSDRWTQETGELTPSLKVKRRVVREKFGDAMRQLQ
ncbi:MAG: long-chain fatty acid--CoA ligase [Fimbriimonadales bacterium]|nr:long-chain fatty acid--CoA ligase [Fimbriimonadales bacterium]